MMKHIFLYGSAGAGKSTIGENLARSLNLPFVDSDRVIESIVGISIPELTEKHGMETVRDFETKAIKQIIDDKEKESVVALGGGALLRDENRLLIESNGKIVLLSATFETLFQRLQEDINKRPVLAGDLKTKLASYLEGRAEHYASFPLKIQVDEKDIEQIVNEIKIALGRYHLSAMGEYDVIVGDLSNLPNLQNTIIVTDENVATLHAKTIRDLKIKTIVVPAGEEHKNLETVHHLWKSFLENGLDRKSTVIAIGGGVIGDMTGFAASAYMRGIDWIAVPTTLLSMVDASLGGKTGFDLPEGKNLIGAFHPPKLVLADVQFLKTLPERELISGMAEVVKHGIISDPELFELCNNGLDWVKNNLEEIVKRAMAVKIKVIEDDPYEKGFRAALNLGHTLGHAVELVSKFKLRHGEAIAIGMVVEAKYSARIGLASRSVVEAIVSALKELNLPTQIPDEMPREEIIKAMRVDKKKNAKAFRFALPVEIGKVELVDVDDLEDVIASEAKQSPN
jgi:shikimate kinase / 3-dehydroquinate synthase